jgi:hypothetical protein
MHEMKQSCDAYMRLSKTSNDESKGTFPSRLLLFCMFEGTIVGKNLL